ncbi:MAG: 7 transmembrane receptor, partial [Planctomycetota bacterium]
MTRLLCDGVPDLPGGLDEAYCGFEAYKEEEEEEYKCAKEDPTGLGRPGIKLQMRGTKCDGVIECPFRDDECNERCRTGCHDGGAGAGANATEWEMCLVDGGMQNVLDRHRCDGVLDCADGRDEAVCPGRNLTCQRHAHTGAGFGGGRGLSTFLPSMRCDFVSDCADGVDEMGCPDHFYCRHDPRVYVRAREKYDGRPHCRDASDECDVADADRYASLAELIKLPLVRALVWVTGGAAVAGNLAVLVVTARKLRRLHAKKNSIPYCNRLLISHLALADLLMGVALYLLGAKSREMSGEYCLRDLAWRSSAGCRAVGFLTVLSSQTSLNILAVLTGARLLVVARRQPTRRVISFRVCWLLVALSWLVAFLFASLPLAIESLAADTVHIRRNPFLGGGVSVRVNASDLVEYARRTDRWLRFLGNGSHPDASHIGAGGVDAWFAASLDPGVRRNRAVVTLGWFGYYGSESVCLPDYYATRAPAKWYSLAVAGYNAAALLFITAAYLVINLTSLPYRSGSIRRRSSVTFVREKATLRRRTALLVATNAACWLPVCACAALASVAGVAMPDSLYPVTQVLLVPINSCLNPLIYSMLLQRLNKALRRHRKRLVALLARRRKRGGGGGGALERHPRRQNDDAASADGSAGDGSGRPRDEDDDDDRAQMTNTGAQQTDVIKS